MPKIMPQSPGSGVTDGEVVSSKATVREGSVSLQYLLLTSSNYAAWSIKMHMYMEAQDI